MMHGVINPQTHRADPVKHTLLAVMYAVLDVATLMNGIRRLWSAWIGREVPVDMDIKDTWEQSYQTDLRDRCNIDNHMCEYISKL